MKVRKTYEKDADAQVDFSSMESAYGKNRKDKAEILPKLPKLVLNNSSGNNSLFDRS